MKHIAVISLFSCTILALSFFIRPSTPVRPPEQPASPAPIPEELGAVHWLRDLDLGQAEAQKTGKPILILFQEVPGCSNCTKYGNTILSHPLIVEAIETCFVPVCIFNNKGGKDGEALKRFNEPSWNNPVVRIVSDEYKDIVPRMTSFYSTLQLLNGMHLALSNKGLAVPRYLELLEEEYTARESNLEIATFSMYCFWKGEGVFGSIPGVVETEPGYQDGREVVKVQFDPRVVKKADLEAQTKPNGVTLCAKSDGFSGDREPKYYLSHTDYAFIPMTSVQACRANSLVEKNQSPEALLSPRQLNLLKKIAENPKKGWKNMIGRKDLAKAWAEAAAI